MSITFRTTTLRDLDPETLAFYERLDRPTAHGFTSDRPATGHPEHGTRSIPPVSVRRISLTPADLRAEKQLAPVTERPTLATACICELDERCLTLYRYVEYGTFDLSAETLAWLPQYVADVEASCPATFHYTSLADSEALAQDTTTIGENESEAVEYWNNVESFNAAYAKRTEEGGRWIETQDGSDLTLDLDREDFQTRIRSHEMFKKRQLRDTMLALGVSPRDAAPWVKSRIDLKRADALREKRAAEAATLWTECFPLPTESQIRLRAYASCLYTLRTKGPKAIRTYEPVVTSPMPRPKATGLTPRMRAQFEKQLKHDWFTPVA